MQADFHMHTNFSTDADRSSTPEVMVEAAIEKGLKTICITDHCDLDIGKGNEFLVDFDEYCPKLQSLKEQYREKINICIGIEFGLQPHLDEAYREIAKKYPFDFIIGSAHVFDGMDPYYPDYFGTRADQEGYRRAFEITLEDIKSVSDFDVLGHLDYIVRYGKEMQKHYSYKMFADYIDEILKYLIENGKGLELNTAGYKYNLGFGHPHPDVLKRYKELGGEIITIGSDAHKPEHVAYDFYRVSDILRDCGFAYYTEFEQRKPKFCQLP